MAAIAGVESSYGRAACRGNRFNVWGLGSCGRSWSPPVFSSWWAAADYYARFLRDRWLDRGVRDVWTMGRTYCPPCGDRWGSAVTWHLDRAGWPRNVTYR